MIAKYSKITEDDYNSKGELVSITVDGTPFIANIKTNDNGLLSYEYSDGTKHTRSYDTNGRVTKLSFPCCETPVSQHLLE